MKNHNRFLFVLYGMVLIGFQTLNSQNIADLNEKGNEHYYTSKDSAYYYFDQAVFISKKTGDWDNYIQSLFKSTGVASYHYDLERMGANLIVLDSTLSTHSEPSITSSSDNDNIFLYYKGDYQLKLYDYANSRKTFQTILENAENAPDSLQTGTLKSLSSAAYSFLGKIYLLEGKYELAKELYNKNIRSLLANDPLNLESLYGNYRLLAEVFRNEGEYQKSNQYLLRTYDYNKENKNTNTVITSAFSLAENYSHLSKNDSALFYLNEAKSHFNENPAFYAKYHLGMANVFRKNGEPDLALKELQTSIKEVEQRLGGLKNSDIAVAYNEIGNIYAEKGDYEKALTRYELAANQAAITSRTDIYILNILKNKSKALNQLHTVDTHLKAMATIDLASSVLDSLKPGFKSKTDKLVLIEDAFPLFEEGIEAAYHLSKLTDKTSYLDNAFTYMEKSKAVLLFEALMSSKATQFANIPKELLERESQLKSEITFIERQLNNAKEKDTKMEEQRFLLLDEYHKLVIGFESEYPAYYNLKYNSEVLSTQSLQRILKEDELLISYFYGNRAIYAIAIGKNIKNLERIPITTQLEGNITGMRELLGNSNSNLDTISALGLSLYRKLLAPHLKTDTPEKLILITDGPLNYLPFGSFNTRADGRRYLVEDFAISNANSATLWSQLRKIPLKGEGILAFAPSFENSFTGDNVTSKKLLPLPHNVGEVEQVMASFPGTAYTNAEASLENFTDHLSEHGMLHLATHAVFDDSSPEYSYLAFTPSQNDDYLLYVQDLYNLNLEADLVTLSACETGVGELKRGEGFLSLARGFFYSGAASIASTLWKVNDASSSKIMASFYKNLSEGATKDMALQQAQKEFMANNEQNALVHPYYWSGFVLSGNTQAITTSIQWPWKVFGLFLLLISLFVFFMYGKRRRG